MNAQIDNFKTFSGRRASQHPVELDSFIELMRNQGCKRYLELGARHGDTFHYVVSSLPSIDTAVAIDLPGGPWGTLMSSSPLRRAADNLVSERPSLQVEALLGNSQSAEIIRQARDYGPYDFVFIDADHRYAGVLADWNVYKLMTRFCAFHDISGVGVTSKTPDRLPVEVPRLWAELRAAFVGKSWEFIAPDSAMGIGVVEVGLPQEQTP